MILNLPFFKFEKQFSSKYPKLVLNIDFKSLSFGLGTDVSFDPFLPQKPQHDQEVRKV